MEQWRPGTAATLVPLADELIQKLDATAGPLPGAYVRFLRTMGVSTGALLFEDGEVDLDASEHWQVLSWFAGANDRFLYIGLDNGPSGCDFYLDRHAVHGHDDCMVVSLPATSDVGLVAPEHIQPLHAGLEEMLYYEAFRQFRLPQFGHHRRLEHRPGVAEAATDAPAGAVVDMAEDLGFTRIPPATRSGLFDRGDAALLLHHVPASSILTLTVSAHGANELDRLCQLLVGTGVVSVTPYGVC
jgi:hypothetical protein